ncbi:MAG: 30S ribosomal protein S4 [Candidatus Magasanikbacteria bacterium]
MGRYIGPKNKIARRFGVNLWLKTNPTKVARRLAQKPGVHGTKNMRRNVSTYGKQLLEKQKAKYVYGIREKQLRRYVDEASRREGDSGTNLQQILETRFDNVIYRMGYAVTRAQARQFVSHNMFLVNGKKMNIPSHLVKIGDTVELKQNKQSKTIFHDISDRLSKQDLPSWLRVDSAKKSGEVTSVPHEKDFDKIFDVKLIIEYYSSR